MKKILWGSLQKGKHDIIYREKDAVSDFRGIIEVDNNTELWITNS
jgi:hypothetical protein